MNKKQTKEFGIYHWDTFEDPGDDTWLVDEADTLDQARELVKKKYGGRIGSGGADQVHIVRLSGRVLERFNVG